MSDVEARLNRYRPAGPPPDLLDRIQGAAVLPIWREPWWHWIAPAAAAAAAIVFYTLASSARADIAMPPSMDEEYRRQVVSDLAAALGGNDFARVEAEQLIELDEQTALAETRRIESVETDPGVVHRD